MKYTGSFVALTKASYDRRRRHAPLALLMMTQSVAANFAPHFAPSPAFVRLVRNSKPQY